MLMRGALWIQILFVLNIFIPLETVKTWTEKQIFPPNLIPSNALDPRRAIVRRKIVLYHNFFRSKVRPTASNMLLMSWNDVAARQAQAYAEQCQFLKHNDIRENTIPVLGTCGQNLFVAAQKTPWFFALKTWFLEYRNFTYGYPTYNLKKIGHYTQMVWATSHKVGCGVAYCQGGPWGHFYNYVCHYCPGALCYPCGDRLNTSVTILFRWCRRRRLNEESKQRHCCREGKLEKKPVISESS